MSSTWSLTNCPWVHIHGRLQQSLEDYPGLQRWYEGVRSRPVTVRAYYLGAAVNAVPTVTEPCSLPSKVLIYPGNGRTE